METVETRLHDAHHDGPHVAVGVLDDELAAAMHELGYLPVIGEDELLVLGRGYSPSTGSVPRRVMEVIPSNSGSRTTVKRVFRSLTFSSTLIFRAGFTEGRSSVKDAPSLMMDSS